MIKLKFTFVLFMLLAVGFSKTSFAQTFPFAGSWEYLKPSSEGVYPFITVVRTIDEKGKYTQIRVTDEGSFIWQVARLEIIDNKTLKEHIEDCINPELIGKTLTLKYSSEGADKNKQLTFKGGAKLVDGIETFEWAESWRKLDIPRAQ